MRALRLALAIALIAAMPTSVVIHVFSEAADSIGPAGFVAAGTTLYGATIAGGIDQNGTVFSMEAPSWRYREIYRFRGGDDGSIPFSAPIVVDGMLYGTASSGGTHGENGTVYELDPTTGVERTLYRFAGGEDGSRPFGSLLAIGDELYGTTADGGGERYNSGTVFAVNRFTGAERVLHRFRPSRGDGGLSHEALVSVSGMLYGTAPAGGDPSSKCPSGCGVIFSVDPNLGRERVLYRFRGGSDGGSPNGVIAVGRELYGTTQLGGAGCAGKWGCGTVFAFDPQSGLEHILYRFHAGRDGTLPFTPPTFSNGRLFGVTSAGGSGCQESRGCGVAYAVDATTGSERVIYRFPGGSGGMEPNSLLAYRESLIGTTRRGGDADCNGLGCGTAFRLGGF